MLFSHNSVFNSILNKFENLKHKMVAACHVIYVTVVAVETN